MKISNLVYSDSERTVLWSSGLLALCSSEKASFTLSQPGVLMMSFHSRYPMDWIPIAAKTHVSGSQ